MQKGTLRVKCPLLWLSGKVIQSKPHRLQKLLAVGFYFGGEEVGQLTVFVDEVFAEVPTGFLAVPAVAGGVGEPLVEGGLVGTFFDVDFLEHGERHAIVALAKLGDVCCRAGLLAHEVVAGEAEHHHLVFVGFVEALPVGVLRGVAALGRDVEEDDFFALVLRKGHWLALQRGHRVVEEGSIHG